MGQKMSVKPLFRYIGGKSFLKDKLEEKIELVLKNECITKYEEWFSGGLGSFFAICNKLKEYKIKEVLLNDINKKLISVYKNIYYGNGENLIFEYMKIENEFQKTIPKNTYLLHKVKDKDLIKINLTNSRDYYKKIVNLFNQTNDNFFQAVYLIFLQNHSFNGIYRENQKGDYNTPFNWEAKKIKEELISNRIKNIENCFKDFNITFLNVDFTELIENKNSVVYLDPPYINNGMGENKYNKTAFNFEKQMQLIDKIKELNFIYSNHFDERILNKFNDFGNIDVEKVFRKNIISASKESRKNDKVEILVIKK